ncbi:hypothetical protein E6C60_1330 [Paenibacillus algicola]|uniref:Uncharacterized protein n=1 Tax=Paenibacillus algicola TaxID=2565926 RepID=A0A4P8XHP2_9BACL|nr:hypothetical protein E6C60_1330 [Paenibacillus algicola]
MLYVYFFLDFIGKWKRFHTLINITSLFRSNTSVYGNIPLPFVGNFQELFIKLFTWSGQIMSV